MAPLTVRLAQDRGHADHGWLKSHHTFSFADYFDPSNMGFRQLRVINEDWVAKGQGFGTHGHADMEIITYMLEGAVRHTDSMGNAEVLRAGEVQRMSAGTGVEHSEMNDSKAEALHLLQIWLLPEKKGIQPGYEQKEFTRADKLNRLRLIVSPEGTDGSLHINQNTRLYAAVLESGHKLQHAVSQKRPVWIQVARGSLTVDGKLLKAGDGAAVTGTDQLTFEAAPGKSPEKSNDEAEFLLFELH